MPKIIRDADVFQAVMQVITARGYDGATTRQLAEAAGVSEVTLFRKYGSKAELVRRAVTHIAENMDFESEIYYSGDVFADLLRVVERYQALVLKYGEFMAVFLPEIHRHPELLDGLSRPSAVMQAIAGLIRQYQQEGMLTAEEPIHAAAALLGPLVYLAMARGAFFANRIPPMDAQAHVRCFLGGRQ
jgi:AcrR family transcriptional regulator